MDMFELIMQFIALGALFIVLWESVKEFIKAWDTIPKNNEEEKLLIKYGYEIKKIMYNIAQENDLNIIEMETDKDYIHILVQYQPIRSVLEIVRLFKQISTYRIWRQNNNANYLKRDFWKENTFWGDGYFACSIGQVSKDIIEKYIQTHDGSIRESKKLLELVSQDIEFLQKRFIELNMELKVE